MVRDIDKSAVDMVGNLVGIKNTAERFYTQMWPEIEALVENAQESPKLIARIKKVADMARIIDDRYLKQVFTEMKTLISDLEKAQE